MLQPKPKFDPNKSFVEVKDEKPKFNPDAPFEVVKKKVSATSTSVGTKLDSEPTSGSSVGKKSKFSQLPRVESFYKTPKAPQTKEVAQTAVSSTEIKGAGNRTQITNLPKLQKEDQKLKAIQTEELSKFRQATGLNDDDLSVIETELNDRKSKSGLLNNIESAASSFGNYITSGGIFGDGDLLADEKKQAEEELKKQGIEKPNEAQVSELADKIFIENRKREIAQDKKSQYLEDLPEQTKTYLEVDAEKRFKTLSKKSANTVNRMKMNEHAANKLLDELEDPNLGAEDKKMILLQVQDISKQMESDLRDYAKDEEALGTYADEFDAFKRNYSALDNFGSRVFASLGELGVGIYSGANYIANTLGAEEEYKQENVTESRKRLEEYRNQFRPDANNISADNFFNYATDLLANQAGNILAISTGAGGIATLGVAGAGQKYNDMYLENQKGANYTPAQMAFVPFASGTATALLSDLPTAKTLASTKRIFMSALKEEGGQALVKEAIINKSKSILAEIGKNFKTEIGTEEMDNLVQNALDKDVLGKDVGYFDNAYKVLKDTALLTGMISSPGALSHVAVSGVKMFSKPDDVKKLDSNGKKIIELVKTLDNPNLSETNKTVIEEQIAKTTKDSEAIVNSTIAKMSNLSEEQIKTVVETEAKKKDLKEKYQEIKLQSMREWDKLVREDDFK